MESGQTSNGKKGGLFKGKTHAEGGIKAIVVDTNEPIEVEKDEVIITAPAVKDQKVRTISGTNAEILSKINQSGGGVPIPSVHEYKYGGPIVQFNPNKLPASNVVKLAAALRSNHPEIWNSYGKSFENEMFEKVKAVSGRGYWTPNEKDAFKVWQMYGFNHKTDHSLANVISMLKCGLTTDKGYPFTKQMVEQITKGVKVEKEHTKTIKKLKKTDSTIFDGVRGIAEDHLEEDSNYYTKLHRAKLKTGGSLISANEKFMQWFIGWYKPISNSMNIAFSLPNNLSHQAGNNVVTMDVFEKISQTIDAKQYLKQITEKADELAVVIYLEPKPRHKLFLDNPAKIKKIDEKYLINYYSNFGFEKENNHMKRVPAMKFAGGGPVTSGVTKIYKDKQDPTIKYWAEESSDGKWYVFSESPRWAKRDEDIDTKTKEDAELIMKQMANITPEFPKRDVHRAHKMFNAQESKFALGGPVTKKYYIFDSDTNSYQEEPLAKKVKLNIDGDFFSVKDPKYGYFTISEGKSGLSLGQAAKTLKAAIISAEGSVSRNTSSDRTLEDTIQFYIDKNGLSPRYSQSEKPVEKPVKKPKPVSVPEVSVEDSFSLNTPTGERSRLTYLQQVLVRTQAFKNFFGDWETAAKNFLNDNKENYIKHYTGVSMVTDGTTLEPKLLFHGTKAEDEFFTFEVSREKGMGRPYAYFAQNEAYSKNFTEFSQRSEDDRTKALMYHCFLNVRKPFMALGQQFEMKSRKAEDWKTIITGVIAYDRYGTIERNEHTQRIEDVVESQIGKYIEKALGGDSKPFWYLMAKDITSDFKFFLISHGYDGIFYTEEIGAGYDPDQPSQYTNAVCIFQANDIKLADGRNLNFDPMKSDIRFDKGGPIVQESEPMERTLSHKEKLGSVLFGKQYAKGGGIDGEEIIQKGIEKMNPDREYVDGLVKKMMQ